MVSDNSNAVVVLVHAVVILPKPIQPPKFITMFSILSLVTSKLLPIARSAAST